MKKSRFFISNFFLWLKSILFPCFFVVLLISLLSFIFYSGQKHRRIISNVENKLIDLTFSLSRPSEPLKSKVVFVSFPPLVNQGVEIDFLRKAAFLSKKVIIFSEEEASFQSLVARLNSSFKSKEILEKFVFSFNPKIIWDRSFFKEYPFLFLENDPCEEGLQRICPYNSKWKKDWLGQYLFETLGGDIAKEFVSHNLQRVFPSYLLKLPKSYPERRFEEIKGKDLNFLRNKVVFIHVKESDSFPKEEISSPYFKEGYTKERFWYEFSDFLTQEKFIRILSEEKSFFLTLSGFFVLFSLVFSFESFFLSFLILSFFLGVFFLSVLSFSFLDFYVPLSDFYFLNLCFLSFLIFLKLSYLSYRRDFDLFLEKRKYEERKFKKIVISIMSHNLNTPLAQMQGLIDLIRSKKKEKKTLKKLNDVESSLAMSFFLVRVFLTMISIQSQKYSFSRSSLEDFVDLFKRESKIFLKNLNLEVDFSFSEGNNQDGFYAALLPLLTLVFCFCFFFKREVNNKIILMLSSGGTCEESEVFLSFLGKGDSSRMILLEENERSFQTKKNSQELLIFRYFKIFRDIANFDFLKKRKGDSDIWEVNVRVRFKKKSY